MEQVLLLIYIKIHTISVYTSVCTPIPRITHNLVLKKKNSLREIRVSGTLLMFQLMWTSPTNANIGQNPRKWKLH